jgi:hypothetical protein
MSRGSNQSIGSNETTETLGGDTMATPVILSLLVGFVVGGACMAMWAATRIEEEAARQFDRGFERGRWLTDITVRAADERDRAVRRLLLPGRPALGPPAAEPRPSLLLLR